MDLYWPRISKNGIKCFTYTYIKQFKLTVINFVIIQGSQNIIV